MSAAGIIEELAVKLGMDVEESGFFKAVTLGNLVSDAIEKIAEAAKELIKFAPETAKYAENARKGALATGTTTDAFQELMFAADETGVPVETLTSGMVKMARTLQGADEGSANLRYTLHTLGISARDANGHTKTTDQILGDLAEKFSKMPDGFEKIGLASEIFGRQAGAALIPFLNKGRDGLAELRGEASKYGKVLNGEAIQASREYTLAQTQLNDAWEGLKLQLGGALIPGTTKFLLLMRDLVLRFKPRIVETFTHALDLFHRAMDGARKAGEYFMQNLKSTGEALLLLLVPIGLVQLGIFLMGGEWVMTAALAVAAAWETAAAWLSAAAPVVGMIALFSVLFLLVQDVFGYFNGQDSVTGDFVWLIQDAWKSMIYGLKDQWQGFKDWIMIVGKEIKDELVKIVTSPMQALKDVGTDFGNIAASIMGGGATFNGPAASPQATAQAEERWNGRGNYPGIMAPLNTTIHINAPGGDPQAIQGAVRQGMIDAYDPLVSALNNALAAVDQ